MYTKEFEEKVVLIIGGSSGMGLAAAEMFLDNDAKVIIAARTAEAVLADLSEKWSAKPGKACAIKTDLSDMNSLYGLFVNIKEHFQRLDIAINCAGVEMKPALLHETPAEVVEQMISINLKMVIYAMQEELKLMLAGPGSGVIVNVSSVAGKKGFAGGACYAAAKGGICLLTRSTAQEYAKRNIRINAVAPGLIETSMAERMKNMDPEMYKRMVASMPMERAGTSEEAAEVLFWLSSQRASFVNGEVINVDSGYLA